MAQWALLRGQSDSMVDRPRYGSAGWLSEFLKNNYMATERPTSASPPRWTG